MLLQKCYCNLTNFCHCSCKFTLLATSFSTKSFLGLGAAEVSREKIQKLRNTQLSGERKKWQAKRGEISFSFPWEVLNVVALQSNSHVSALKFLLKFQLYIGLRLFLALDTGSFHTKITHGVARRFFSHIIVNSNIVPVSFLVVTMFCL